MFLIYLFIYLFIYLLCYLFQVKSGKELKAFLFNDFLMLTRPQTSIAGSLSKKIGFESNEHDVMYDIYRKVRQYQTTLMRIFFPSVISHLN